MALADFTAGQLVFLTVLVFFAGVVDALAGGGGLVTLPAYLSVGLPPGLVLGTNKLASSIGTVASTWNYQRRHKLVLKDLGPAVAASLIGSWLGAKLAGRLDPSWLRWMLIAVIPVLAFFLYSKRRFGHGDESGRHSKNELVFRNAAVSMPIGAYDGFFGPGTGTFLALGFTRVCGYDLLGATVRAKVLNLASNAAALAAFLSAGTVHLPLGLAMGAVSVAGHYAGSHWGLQKGAQAIRPAVLLVCAGLFVKLLLDAFSR